LKRPWVTVPDKCAQNLLRGLHTRRVREIDGIDIARAVCVNDHFDMLFLES
jgi:hypothetical protein